MTLLRRRLGPGDVDHERLWLGVGALGFLVLVAFRFGMPWPAMTCPWKALTGWPCLGCGTMRALQALAGGSVGSAFRLHPLVTTALALWVAWGAQACVVLLGGRPRLRIVLAAADLSRLRWLAGATVLATWTFLILDGR